MPPRRRAADGAALAAELARAEALPPPTGKTVTWRGRVQILDAMPEDGRGACIVTACNRELCYCARCVHPETMRQAIEGPFCHECWAEYLGWGPGRRLHHCSTCTCTEGERWG